MKHGYMGKCFIARNVANESRIMYSFLIVDLFNTFIYMYRTVKRYIQAKVQYCSAANIKKPLAQISSCKLPAGVIKLNGGFSSLS